MRYPILGLLASGHSHGYDMKRAFDEQFGSVWPPVNIGQVYITLSRLERDGLIKSKQVKQSSRPNKKVYELTEQGKAALEEWVREASLDKKVRDDFFMKLVLARLAGVAEPTELIAQHRHGYLQALKDLGELARSDDRDGEEARLLVEGTILHLEADLRWLDLCEQHFVNGGVS